MKLKSGKIFTAIISLVLILSGCGQKKMKQQPIIFLKPKQKH